MRISDWSSDVCSSDLIAIVSNRAGGLIPLTDALERVGFNVGNTRFSLLSMLTLSVTVVALFAGIRLANRITEHSIARVRDFDPAQKLLAQKLAELAIIVGAFFICIDIAGIDLTEIAVFSVAAVMAIGRSDERRVGKECARACRTR